MMPQSLSQIYIHLVFSTKNRKPWLRKRKLCDQLFAYIASIMRDVVDSPALAINGVDDHVHSLLRLSRRFSIMNVVQKAKTETCKWLKRQSACGNGFEWQTGYGAFSVSPSLVEQVQKYIQNQIQHHQRMTFQDEFRELCKRHGLELDERYAWN